MKASVLRGVGDVILEERPVPTAGPGVDSLVPGQRVSIEPGVPCRSCAQCLAGRSDWCALRLPLPYVQQRELVLTGAFRYANTWPTAIALVASGRVDPDALVTGHFGLDHVEQALTAARHDPLTVKVVVHPAL